MARILIETHHPSDIHFWKFAIRVLQERGHTVLMLTRDRDVMLGLLEGCPHIRYEVISHMGRSNRFPFAEFLRRQWGVVRSIHRFQPDVVASMMGSYTQSAWLFRKPNIVFTDSEFQCFNHRIAHPFATEIHTPTCFSKPLGRKHRRYNGFHELAGLDPRYFRPNSSVRSALDPDGRGYAILRVSAWNTLHDIGKSGLGTRLREIITELEPHHRVWISPEEGRIDADLENRRLTIKPADYPSALAFARVVVTEGASTASEAAVLGVPTLYINPASLGYIDYLESKYELLRQTRSPDVAPVALRALLEESRDPANWRKRAENLFADHVDVVGYIADSLGLAALR